MFLVEKGSLFIYIGCRKTKGIVSWDSLGKSSFALGPMHNTDIQKIGIGHILPGGPVARPLYTNTKDGLVLLHNIRAITNQHR